MGFNWIDYIILLVVTYYVFDGWQRGVVLQLVNLLSFITSLYLAVRFGALVGSFFVEKFGVPVGWTNVLGYIVVAFAVQLAMNEIGEYSASKLPKKLSASYINHYAGSVVSVITGLVTVTFFLLLILALPVRGAIKKDIAQSYIGTFLVHMSDWFGGRLTSSLSDITKDAIKFLTVEPESHQRINLDLPSLSASLSVDGVAETSMISLINRERKSNGLSPLRTDARMTMVAQSKSRDMFEHRYFSHADLEGNNAGDRLQDAGIAYTLVGENLAFAPDTDIAHQGLMNSLGHRANILEPRFGRVGIGIIDGGIYGKMFTQLFAD